MAPLPLTMRTAFAAILLLLLALPVYAQQPAPPQPVQGPTPRTATDTVPGRDTAATPAAERSAAEQASDSIFRALLQLPGYTPVEYTGENAVFQVRDRVLRLHGSAEVTRQGDRLTADTIVYREETRLVEAYGSPTVTGQGEAITGARMLYDLDTRRSTVLGGRTTVSEGGAAWLVQGDVTAEGSARLYTTQGIFTTDDREEPAYYFQADRIMVLRDRVLVGQPARLYFKNVPVMWLPFVVQDLTRGRRSGLLTPRFGMNDIVRTSSGYSRQISNVGFFWAMNDYMGAELAGDWRSGAYTSLVGTLQYRWLERFVNGSFSYRQFWNEGGNRQLAFSTNNSWQPAERTNVSLNANYASSSAFVRDITTDPREAMQTLGSNFALGHRFDWGNLNLNADRRQSIANDEVNWTLPSVGLNLNTITLFRAATPEEMRWYSNATLSLGGSGMRTITDVAEDITRGLRDRGTTQMALRKSFGMGNLSWATAGSLNRSTFGAVAAVDTFPGLPRLDLDQGTWSTGLSYRQSLIGNTAISPNLQISQEIRSDTLSDGRYVGAPLRLSFGSALSTDLYGLFPGIGSFSAIRHRISPQVNYSYAPQVQQTPEQERIFGRAGGRAQNRISLQANQTWEAKLRTPTSPRQDPGTAEEGDTAAATTERPAIPAEPQKVMLLSLTTTAFEYDFAKAGEMAFWINPTTRDTTFYRESGFTTRQVTNTVSSDYLRGLHLTVNHDLFEQTPGMAPGQLGRFAPFLSGVSTSFSFGEGSTLVRFMSGLLGFRAEETTVPPTRAVPTEEAEDPIVPPGVPTATGNPQPLGSGPWNVSLNYSLVRSRGVPAPPGFGTGPGTGFGPGLGYEAQNLGGNLSFSPTPNWSVHWSTNYSITDGQFGDHRLTLRRDLYRWEANFNFTRTIYGNTSFDVLVRLKDLPDLKVDYRERNIGADRRR